MALYNSESAPSNGRDYALFESDEFMFVEYSPEYCNDKK